MIFAYYNGVHFRDVIISNFEQRVVYDESNTDLIYSQFEISLSATLTDYAAAFRTADTPDGTDPTSIYPDATANNGNSLSLTARIRHLEKVLAAPRGDFWLIVGGTNDTPNRGNGPTYKPLVVAAGLLHRWHEGDPSYVPGSPVWIDPDNPPATSIPHNKISPFPPPYRTGLPTADQMAYRQEVCDMEGGPTPTNVAIDQMFGGRSLRCTMSINCALIYCDYPAVPPEVGGSPPDQDSPWWIPEFYRGTEQFPDNERTNTLDPHKPLEAPPGPHFITPGNQVMNNKWSIQEEQDENWLTTRTISGTLRTRHPDFSANIYRKLVVPPLPVGYRRVAQRFVTDPTDTTLAYVIVDRQVQATPPYPAIAWEGDFTYAISQLGARQVCNFSLVLTGAPGVNKQLLMERGLEILAKRIPDLQKKAAGGADTQNLVRILQLSCTDIIGEARIRITAQALLVLPDAGSPYGAGAEEPKFVNIAFKWLMEDRLTDPVAGLEGGYDDTLAPVPIPWDSQRPVGLFRNYLQSPCSYYHGISQFRQWIDPEAVYNPGRYHKTSDPNEGPVNPVAAIWTEAAGGEKGIVRNKGNDPFSAAEQGEEIVVDDVEALLQVQQTFLLTQDDNNIFNKGDETHNGASVPYEIYKSPYNEYALSARYVTPVGKLHLPYAKPLTDNTTAIAANVHAPLCRKIVEIRATRDNEYPVIPDFVEERQDGNGITETLLEVEISPKAPVLQGDGTGRTYQCDIRATYALSRPPTDQEKLEVGSNPTDSADPIDHVFDLKRFTDRAGYIYDNTATPTPTSQEDE